MNLNKPLPHILFVIADLANQKRVVQGDMLFYIFMRGANFECNCKYGRQRYKLMVVSLKTNTNALIFFRAKNGKDV